MKAAPIVTVTWKLVIDHAPVIAGNSAGRNLETAKLKAVVDCVAWAEAVITKLQAPLPDREPQKHD